METTNIPETNIPDYPRGLTFEQVWASIQELKVYQKESGLRMEEAFRQMRENSERTEREMKASMSASAKRLDKKLGDLGNRFGEMIESLASPGLRAKFRALGLDFTESSRDKEFAEGKRIVAEVDVFLENNETAMVVEIKSKPVITDIKEQIERMEKLRAYADGKGDKRKYFSAIAGMTFGSNVRNYALKHGLYVIEPSGNTFAVIAPSGEFKPREW